MSMMPPTIEIDIRETVLANGSFGPHEIRLLPQGDTLVVANGGIETHPDSGRSKLNLPTMRPNLAYITIDGALKDRVAPPDDFVS